MDIPANTAAPVRSSTRLNAPIGRVVDWPHHGNIQSVHEYMPGSSLVLEGGTGCDRPLNYWPHPDEFNADQIPDTIAANGSLDSVIIPDVYPAVLRLSFNGTVSLLDAARRWFGIVSPLDYVLDTSAPTIGGAQIEFAVPDIPFGDKTYQIFDTTNIDLNGDPANNVVYKTFGHVDDQRHIPDDTDWTATLVAGDVQIDTTLAITVVDPPPIRVGGELPVAISFIGANTFTLSYLTPRTPGMLAQVQLRIPEVRTADGGYMYAALRPLL